MEPGYTPPPASAYPNAIVDQPPPRRQDGGRSVQDMVREDFDERERVGVERYGTPLQAYNGRNPLIDAYQGAMDLTVYLRQAIEEERGNLVAELRRQVYELRMQLQREQDLSVELRKQLAICDRTRTRPRDEPPRLRDDP